MAQCSLAIIGSNSVVLASRARRLGVACHTEYTCKRASQYRRADAAALNVVDSDKPEDVAFLDQYLSAYEVSNGR